MCQNHSKLQSMQFMKSTLFPLRKAPTLALLLHTVKHSFYSVFYMDWHAHMSRLGRVNGK